MAKQLKASKAQLLVISTYEETHRANRGWKPKTEKPSVAVKWVEFYSFLKKRREVALEEKPEDSFDFQSLISPELVKELQKQMPLCETSVEDLKG